MRIVAVVQARMGSKRLPGKVMKIINNKPILEILIERLNLSNRIDEIVIATSSKPENALIKEYFNKEGFNCEMGSENDVLSRFYNAAKKYKADVVVRITGDCPFVDADVVDSVIDKFFESDVDYCSNVSPPSFPDGMDVEVFNFKSLEIAFNETHDLSDREHVTTYMRSSDKFKKSNKLFTQDLSKLRWTLDEQEDLEVIEKVFQHFKPNFYFSWLDVLSLYKDKPSLFDANKKVIRNEGFNMGSGQKMWKRAKLIIPGGNMLLSKRPDMFLPELWPSYFEKAKGCEVWDMDGKKYIDMSIMGIGTNILGYGNDEVDNSVTDVVSKGNMSTLNCPEEVYLAEKLVKMHPWADMVRLARTGGEANSVAIRIARAASNKTNVAFCGYHGWHDWYLAANLGDQNSLDGQLLPGLEPKGVPPGLKDTSFPFKYNDYVGLKSLVDNKNIGIIKMEVVRNFGPKNNFLEKVRKLCDEKNIVLIFDECTSGFRESFGGLHKNYNVDPDIAMFGKAMGNGYAITAIIGRRSIMESAQSTFISSTFWTERIGPAAALKTLEIMEREKSWDVISMTGKIVRTKWQELADLYNLEISHFGLDSLAGFSFNSKNSQKYKTFITQEMLSKGYLAGTSFYASTQHSTKIINDYFENLEPVFKEIAECENGRNIDDLLKAPVCHSGFKRLN